ncbi:RagB/SusD family nutrient uptake outer membrane protein [Niabella drilacis]|uniref:Starch-binding associating with outer membrane n=1 Tax=Niabella drilacis (strain DSM 25811 / CCM 8410 / CCUG 62505 / LMG 26954 / E90) TaxID=1285928 RepID=A0A1G7A792_NIADE|nr:RagB/SusD family nutrient uptake outer membrane protein [Niabella drilacis]SDE10641.1 Starch-binding associating with outer membrane [Niabella drilacis]
MRLSQKRFLLFICTAIVMTMTRCKKGLDFNNLSNLNPDLVWTDSTMIKSFLSSVYSGLMPGWPVTGANSDEAINKPKNMNDYLRGIISVSTTTSSLDYNYIDRLNYFLDKLSVTPDAVLATSTNLRLTGEAKFWRAWAYWRMVNEIGGVPLILHTQQTEDASALFVPRNKTSECIAQMVRDLDSAALLLPGVYPNAASDYGRITKVAAMAFKGRVLLNYASPRFNPDNDAARWQNAYNATKAAVDYGISQGHGLYPNYRDIWYKERNQEVIMVNQYFYPNHPTDFGFIQPLSYNNNQPLLSLLLAYPKKDGTPMQFDKDQLANPVYNTQFLTDFYMNRDDRFNYTIFCGGNPYVMELAPPYVKGQGFWVLWKYDATNKQYMNIMKTVHPGLDGILTSTGFYEVKGMDTTVTRTTGTQAQTDWPEIRFAELLMNYGECANELGKSNEALQVLYQVRKRAGIAAGASETYGIAAASQEQIRQAYIAERFVEFAFENMRFNDLRRWKRFDILNSQGARHGLFITIKEGEPMVTPNDVMTTPSVRAKFTANYIDNLDGDPAYKYNLDLNHWFNALPANQISQSKNVLTQNKEWGGTFDPLQ